MKKDVNLTKRKGKKIGLLTLPLIDNYGGIIQIAALYDFLKTSGYNPYFINKKHTLSKTKVLIKKILEHNPFYKVYDYNSYAKRRLYLKKIKTFVDTFFTNRTSSVLNKKDLYKACKGFDAVIVGSDQVWRYKYIKKDFESYFLSSIDKSIKKISYAASFGIDEWEGPEKSIKEVSRFLSEFSALSVREDTGVDLCRELFHINDVDHVLDPTFLPKISFYEELITQENHNEEIGLFNYVLDPSEVQRELIQIISEKMELHVNRINLENDLTGSSFKPSVSEWLYHFKTAKFIVTDSFHGMIFSILFNKQFIIIGNNSRGLTRFTSLLKSLDLQKRIIVKKYNEKDIDYLLSIPIDYEVINKKIEILKNKSVKFLIDSLNKNL